MKMRMGGLPFFINLPPPRGLQAAPEVAVGFVGGVYDRGDGIHPTNEGYALLARANALATHEFTDSLRGLGIPTDLGSGTTIAANLSDMAGATFSSAADSLENIRDNLGGTTSGHSGNSYVGEILETTETFIGEIIDA